MADPTVCQVQPGDLALTPVSEDHIADVQRYVSDPRIAALSNVPFPYPADGAALWYQNATERVARGSAAVFAVTEKQAFRGIVGINCIENRAAQVDYWVAVPYQRRGIGSQAVALAVEYARTVLGLECLLSQCLTLNNASARVLQRNGFHETSRETIAEGKFAGQELRHFRRRLAISR
jgi:[ribosomal protein S5]-alanine N-acetyltransferase